LEERRKSKRFRIPFEVEIITPDKTDDYVLGEVKDFSPEGFSFEAKNIDPGINKTIKARFKLLPESSFVHVLGRIMWKIQFGDDSHVGVEIKEIESEVNSDNLSYPFDMWIDKIRNK
jgi:hypothetical protein